VNSFGSRSNGVDAGDYLITQGLAKPWR